GWPGFTAQVHYLQDLPRLTLALGMAGIHRSSTLVSHTLTASFLLGMAGIHRSSTLRTGQHDAMPTLGMAGIHRSSTLGWLAGWQVWSARDGRDSPLKYTVPSCRSFTSPS